MDRSGIILGALGAVVVGTVFYSEMIVKPKAHDGKVVVTYWEKWTSFEADAMRDVVDEFNKSQDKIFVDYLSVSSVDQKTLLATASGIPPDLAGLYGPNMAGYAEYDALTDMTQMAAEAGIKRENYIPVFYDMCTMNGKLLALPTTPASVALHYNKDILKKGGWDPDKPPTTFEELDKMDAQLMKKEGDKVVLSGFMPAEPGWWPWAWPYYFGGSLFDEKGQVVTADKPENIKAYDWMAGYAKRYGAQAFADYKSSLGGFDSPQNAFINGKLGSEIQGVWMANFIGKHNKKLNWAAAPFVHPADRPDLAGSSMVDLDIIVIPTGAKHVKEAFEFLKFVESQHGMEKLCFGQKKVSPLAVQSPEFEKNHPNPFVGLFRQLCFGKNVISPPKTPIWAEYQSRLGPMIDEMNLGTKTPAQAMKELQTVAAPLQEQINATHEARRKAGLLP